MKVKLIAIGKLKSKPFAELVDDYAGRVKRYLNFELLAPKDERSIKLDGDDLLIVCDENGKELTSKGLSELIAYHQRIGTKKLTFFIGDAKGVSKEMKAKARSTLSLSRMTFPHELARVIMLEQMYRACTILKNEKYHYA